MVVGRYRFLEAIALADCAVDLEGEDLNDLFETGAAALAELMVDPTTLTSSVTRQITLEAESLDLLLYDWLSELIYLKDTDRVVFGRTAVIVQDGRPSRLSAEASGGIIDPARTVLRADPKAVTFHQFRLDRRAEGWRARVVIDI